MPRTAILTAWHDENPLDPLPRHALKDLCLGLKVQMRAGCDWEITSIPQLLECGIHQHAYVSTCRNWHHQSDHLCASRAQHGGQIVREIPLLIRRLPDLLSQLCGDSFVVLEGQVD